MRVHTVTSLTDTSCDPHYFRFISSVNTLHQQQNDIFSSALLNADVGLSHHPTSGYVCANVLNGIETSSRRFEYGVEQHLNGGRAPPRAMTSSSYDNDVSESAARLLFGIVHWARNVCRTCAPQLSPSDLVSLLSRAWTGLFVLSAAAGQWAPFVGRPYSLPVGLIHSDVPSSLPGHVGPEGLELRYDRQGESRTQFSDGLLTQRSEFYRQLEILKLMRMDPTEFSCLKSIVLFNAGLILIDCNLTVLLHDFTSYILKIHVYVICTLQK